MATASEEALQRYADYKVTMAGNLASHANDILTAAAASPDLRARILITSAWIADNQTSNGHLAAGLVKLLDEIAARAGNQPPTPFNAQDSSINNVIENDKRLHVARLLEGGDERDHLPGAVQRALDEIENLPGTVLSDNVARAEVALAASSNPKGGIIYGFGKAIAESRQSDGEVSRPFLPPLLTDDPLLSALVVVPLALHGAQPATFGIEFQKIFDASVVGATFESAFTTHIARLAFYGDENYMTAQYRARQLQSQVHGFMRDMTSRLIDTPKNLTELLKTIDRNTDYGVFLKNALAARVARMPQHIPDEFDKITQASNPAAVLNGVLGMADMPAFETFSSTNPDSHPDRLVNREEWAIAKGLMQPTQDRVGVLISSFWVMGLQISSVVTAERIIFEEIAALSAQHPNFKDQLLDQAERNRSKFSKSGYNSTSEAIFCALGIVKDGVVATTDFGVAI